MSFTVGNIAPFDPKFAIVIIAWIRNWIYVKDVIDGIINLVGKILKIKIKFVIFVSFFNS